MMNMESSMVQKYEINQNILLKVPLMFKENSMRKACMFADRLVRVFFVGKGCAYVIYVYPVSHMPSTLPHDVQRHLVDYIITLTVGSSSSSDCRSTSQSWSRG